MAKGSPTAFVAASEDVRGALHIKSLLETEHVKVATSTDLLGVGLAAALKNPYAIALGMCDGLKHPTNAKAFLLTVAIAEMRAILKAANAEAETADGLAGLGDLIVTGFSPHGRNRTYGERLVGAESKDPKELGLTTVEGIHATELAAALAKRLGVETPLLDSVTNCLQAKNCFAQPFEMFLKEVKI
jgi:glycerol-3-phosphate dehydrogenase (NAD(P)+)